MKHFIVCVGILATIFGCGESSISNNSDSRSQDGIVFSQEQRNIADQIISVFENNTPVIQYVYSEHLHDGRGITAGHTCFTSAAGDRLEVIKRYTVTVPDNPLAVYLPRLRELAQVVEGLNEIIGT